MPTYEYECRKCGGVIELFQGITEKPKRKLHCETCGREDAGVPPAQGAGVGIVFKGSGFYTTDYRSASYKKAAEADKPATESKGDAAKSSGSTDTKTQQPKAKDAVGT